MKYFFSSQILSDNAKQQILQILEKVALLTPAERLLLYLRMPGGYPETGKHNPISEI
jgi:hypothetical protein